MTARLLVVDDEVEHMKALCNTLELEGFRPTGFSSPKRALESLEPERYELLLTDLMMPELDGIELVRAARAIDPHLAGVVMTGHGTIDTAVAALQVGALDYVQKPFRLNVILTVIARALDTRSLRIENAELQRREREHAAALAAAYKDLESFSYSVSHDLRAPLRAIRSFTEMYLADFGAGVPDEGRRYLDHVVNGAERMDRLIEDLLTFCRFSRAPLTKGPIEIGPMARYIVDDLRAQNPGRIVDVRIGELPDCVGDASLVQQVLVNLLSNAFKFTGGKSEAVIEIGCRAEPPSAERIYFVRDNGAGFDMKYADKLFGVFQRLHSQQQFGGTGVGLSIVHRIVQRHGGRIWAESAPDAGATFHFTLQDS